MATGLDLGEVTSQTKTAIPTLKHGAHWRGSGEKKPQLPLHLLYDTLV
jgi:hypothetical protein